MFFCRQLHVLLSFPVLAVSSDDFKIRLLWLSKICHVIKYRVKCLQFGGFSIGEFRVVNNY